MNWHIYVRNKGWVVLGDNKEECEGIYGKQS